MKKVITGLMVIAALCIQKADAQFVRMQPSFHMGVSVGPAPYPGAVWVGPEWVWRGGRYEEVPGYWARPGRPYARWIPGHWRMARRGYRWVPGHWR